MGNLILARIEIGKNSRLADDSWTRWLVRLVWCAVIGAELFLLLDDITLFRSPKSELLENTGERVAEIRESVNGVRWQSPKDIVWNEGYTGQALYEGQSLMTLSDSEVRLAFDSPDGAEKTELWIGPKTLIQLSPPHEAKENPAPLLLSLSRGKIRTKTSRPIVLSSGEFSIQVDAGTTFQATLPGGPTKAIELEVTEGRVHSGNRLVIEKGQRLSLPIEKLSEESLNQKAVPIAVEAPIEVAPQAPTAPAPTPKARSRALPPPTLKAPILRPRKKTTELTPRVQKNRLKAFLNSLVPSAHADESASEFEFEIELGWDPVPGAKNYQIQISKTRAFSELVVDETSEKATYLWLYKKGMENSKGRVFYRIASIDPTGKKGNYSKPRVLAIPKIAVAETPAPRPTATAASAPPPAPAPPPEKTTRVSAAALYSSYAQSSDTALLRNASTTSPFIHETLELASLSLKRELTLRLSRHSLEGTPSALPKTRRLGAALTAEKNSGRSFFGKNHPLFIGGIAEFGQRLEKSGSNSIALSSGLSIGPSLSFSPLSNLKIALTLPLSGFLLKGFFAGPAGARLAADYTLSLANYGEFTHLCLTLKILGSRYYWKQPEGTTVTEWSVGAGPTLIF